VSANRSFLLVGITVEQYVPKLRKQKIKKLWRI
jgi:hypothetical protein